MFTGLIEEVGTIAALTADGCSAKLLTIEARIVSEDARIGASIAINGCCLTIVGIDARKLDFQAGSETLSRTNLGQLVVGDAVNLERAVAAGDRLGGHFVSGHIDAIATVIDRTNADAWSTFWFSVPGSLTRQMASKGSIAVDGVSLTVVEVESDRFSVALIPHTLAETTLGQRQIGEAVNVETDILAKYVQQQVEQQKVQKPADV